MKKTTIIHYINLDELCLVKRGDAKAHKNKKIFEIEKNIIIDKIKIKYNINDVDISEDYVTDNDYTFLKIGFIKNK